MQKTLAVEKQLSYAEHYAEGVFKVTEFFFHVSPTARQVVNSGALMLSSDRGTTKRIMNFRQNSQGILANAESVIVLYQFLDLPHLPPMRRNYSITDRANSSITYIIDDEILTVGTTRLVQHVYVDYGNGKMLDVGRANAMIETSFIDGLMMGFTDELPFEYEEFQ